MNAIFTPLETGSWLPTELAQGPFAGLQGGAVAGLLVAEIEAFAAAQNLGHVVGVSVAFYRSTPMERVHTQLKLLHAGRRACFVENTLTRADGQTCATVRATLVQEQAVAIPNHILGAAPIDPSGFALRKSLKAPHGKPWFMDSMQARVGDDGVAWFKVNTPIILGAGYFSKALGPADWCHGINRPSKLGDAVMADPNQDLNVHLAHAPRGDWLGIRANTLWQGNGIGLGYGTLCDAWGDIGSVSMSVALVAVP